MAALASFDIGSYNPVRLRPGEAIKAADWAHLPGLINAGLAYAGTGTVVSQSWQGGLRVGRTVLVDPPLTALLEWRLPVLSDVHLAIEVWIQARVVWDGEGALPHAAHVYTSVPGEDDEIAQIPVVEDGEPVPWNVAAWINLNTAQDRSDYTIGTVRLGVDVDGGEVPVIGSERLVEIHAVMINILPADLDQRINSGVPLDATGPMFGADKPLCAAAGKWLRDGVEAIRPRPRPVVAWAAITPGWLANAVAVDAAQEAFGAPAPEIGIRGLMPPIDWHGVAGHALWDGDPFGIVQMMPFSAQPSPTDEPEWRSQHELRIVGLRERAAPLGLIEMGSFPIDLDPIRALTIWTAELMGEDLLQGNWQVDEL